jgi:hypothetical protein
MTSADLPFLISVVTLLATVWKASSVSTEMKVTIASLQTTVKKLENDLVQLQEIAPLKLRVAQLEEITKYLQKEKVSTDKFRAVTEREIERFQERRASSPEIVPPIPREDPG